MSVRLGLATLARPEDGRFLELGSALRRDCSEESARRVHEEVRALLARAEEEARALLTADRPTLQAVAAALLERETLDREAFEALLAAATLAAGAGRVLTPSPPPPAVGLRPR